MSNNAPTLVMLGIDADGKPHGCWFGESTAELAVKAAHLMGFHALKLSDIERQKKAAELPAGKVFASGRAFAPLIKRALYDKFAPLIGTDAEQPAEQASNAAGTAAAEPVSDHAAAAPDPWAAIVTGELVLADTLGEGWFETIVVAAEPGNDILTLRWRDYPREPHFKSQRRKLAVIARTEATTTPVAA